MKYEAGEVARQQHAANGKYRDAILHYIASMPGHIAKRAEMLRVVSKQEGISQDQLTKIYKGMVKGRIVSEKKNGNRYEVKKSPKKTKKAKEIKLPMSVYIPENYAKVSRKTVFKVEYTVGAAENIDRVNNTGEFISKASGEKYYTSLERCTCMAYKGEKDPCKHMVALAIQLGYYRTYNAI